MRADISNVGFRARGSGKSPAALDLQASSRLDSELTRSVHCSHPEASEERQQRVGSVGFAEDRHRSLVVEAVVGPRAIDLQRLRKSAVLPARAAFDPERNYKVRDGWSQTRRSMPLAQDWTVAGHIGRSCPAHGWLIDHGQWSP